MTHRIIIDDLGFIRCISNSRVPLHELGTVSKRRVSTITPMFAPKKQVFWLLRKIFGEQGRVAEFTRRWRGPWIVKIIATGEWSVFTRRESAIEWELMMLNGDVDKWL